MAPEVQKVPFWQIFPGPVGEKPLRKGDSAELAGRFADLMVQNGASPSFAPSSSPSSVRGSAKAAQLCDGLSVFDRELVRLDEVSALSGGLEARLREGNRINYSVDAAGMYQYTITPSNGRQVTLSAPKDQDLHLRETAEGLAVLNRTTGEALVYHKDGSTTPFADRTLFDDLSGDDLIINWTAANVTTGDGDDVVLNFANGSSIRTGAGNDHLYLADDCEAVEADLGEGDDVVQAGHARGGSIIMGNGNNTLVARELSNTTVTAGHGNNSVYVQTLSDNARVTLGHGDNRYAGQRVENGAGVHMGHGNNAVNVSLVADGAKVVVGNGNNDLIIQRIENSKLQAGHGNNRLENSHAGKADFRFGNGNNRLRLYTVKDGSLLAGHGNNTFEAYELLGSHMRFGNGNNKAAVYSVDGTSGLRFGNGHNKLSINEFLEGASLQLGNGNNAVVLNRAGAGLDAFTG